MSYRIESNFKLESDWLPAKAFNQHYATCSAAVAIAIEGVDELEEQEVRVILFLNKNIEKISENYSINQ